MKFKLVLIAFFKKSYMLLNNYYIIFKQALFILNYDVHHKLSVCILLFIDLCYFLFQIMGNTSEFKRAVNLIIENVSFDTNNTVQVFEANIRFVFQLLKKKKERCKILVVVYYKKYNNLLILTLFFLNYTGI